MRSTPPLPRPPRPPPRRPRAHFRTPPPRAGPFLRRRCRRRPCRAARTRSGSARPSSWPSEPRDAVEREEEILPDEPVAGGPRASGGGEPAVAPAALALLLDPPAFDEAGVLEPVERGIERRDVVAERAAGALDDQAPDLVAVAGAVLDEREDQEVGRPLFL